MDERKAFFKNFVRCLNKSVPYEDRKALALQTLRTRYGQEKTLMASEDRLLSGVFQHRAGEFPWGTSKKDRVEARARKRKHANSSASMPSVLPSEPLVINLLDVKEEEVQVGRRLRRFSDRPRVLLTDSSHGIRRSPFAARRCWASPQSHPFGWSGDVVRGCGWSQVPW